MTRTIVRERIPSRDPRLKRHVHHDSESRRFAFDTAGLSIVSAKHTRRIPVLDQGNLGSCFPPGTRIRMSDGSERTIEAVRLGERVVTAEGNTGRVVRTLLRDEDGGLVRLALWGHAHLRMTREHPVLTARGYVQARDLKIGDEVAMPRYVAETPTLAIRPRELVRRYQLGAVELPDKIELTPAAGRLLGLWLAEGSADGTKVRWHYGSHEAGTLVPETVRLCREVLGVDVHPAERPNGTWWVTLYGIPWNELFKTLGGLRVESKRPHPVLCSGAPEFLAALLDGWLAGDGCYRKDGSAEGVSISADLALAMFDVGQALGRHPVIDWRESTQNSAARVRQPRWTLTFAPGQGRCRQTETHVWRKVRAISVEDYVGPVYDLTVEGDHSYVAEGIGVHNCTGNAGIGCLGTDPYFTALQYALPDRMRLQRLIYTLDEAGAVQLYSDATRADPYPGEYPPEDTGSDGLTIAKVLRAAGEIAGYTHTFSLDDALKALGVMPFVTGTVWYTGMFTPLSDGRVQITGSVAGGHEYVADEIDAERERVWFTNSWGTGWGVGGRFYLTFTDYGTLLSQQGDVTIFTPLTDPVPTPTPPEHDPADVSFAAALRHRGWVDRPRWFGTKTVARSARTWLRTKGL